MTAAAKTVRKGRKYDQVLEGARDIFMRDGFDGASVDDIAQQAGVSKATLYSYFPDKRLLFMAVANAECQRQADAAVHLIDLNAAPAIVLTAAAKRFVAFVMSDFGIRIYRICVAESDRFPELGQTFYQSGPLLVRQRIVGYLRCAAGRGELVIDDFDLAADQFAELCKASIFSQIIFGISASCRPAEIERTIKGAVEMFMVRYGAKD
ncbi:MAG: TetR/AcrR family transcriptional regulator [Paracoccaceae bacterium]|nr:TetR/AcrR family transcriptional regulator [Paracoccaceae bacterium]